MPTGVFDCVRAWPLSAGPAFFASSWWRSHRAVAWRGVCVRVCRCCDRAPSECAWLCVGVQQCLGSVVTAHQHSSPPASGRLPYTPVVPPWHLAPPTLTLISSPPPPHTNRWMMVLTCVARLFPRLTSVALLCGSRITPAIFAERMAALSITSIQLQVCLRLHSCSSACWFETATPAAACWPALSRTPAQVLVCTSLARRIACLHANTHTRAGAGGALSVPVQPPAGQLAGGPAGCH